MSIQTVNPNGAQTLTNYGGKIPTPTTNVKQFYQNDTSTVTWYYKNISGTQTLTPTIQNSLLNVSIPGNLTVNGTIYNPSDISLKENIKDIAKEDYEKVLQLEPKKYNLKSDPNKNEHFGLIAQDLEKLFPELVNMQSSGNSEKKHINYLELIPIMIAKMKHMQEQMGYLELIPLMITKMEEMQKQIDYLKEHKQGESK